MKKPYPALCRECKWSDAVDHGWDLRCSNPVVNGNDPWALASVERHQGSSCKSEREIKWFAKCGIKGKLWEAK